MKIVSIGLAVSLWFAGAGLAADISIATIGPMSGQYETFGAQMKAGAEQAVADINAAGGVNGKKLKLIIEDDACDPSQAVVVARRLAAMKVALIAGHLCSGASILAAAVYAKESIVQISPAATNPKLTDERAGPGVFRVSGRDDRQGRVAAAFMAKRYAGGKIAILHDNTAYGRGLAYETRKHLNKADHRAVMYEAYRAGANDYSALISRMKQAAIDVAYVGGHHIEAGLIVRQMRQHGMKTQLIAGDALVTREFWQVAREAGDGTLMTFAPDPRNNPAAGDVVRKFRARKIEPEGYVLYTYAAVQAWAQAARAAQSEASAKVIDALNTGEFSTVLGTFKFDKKGDPTLPSFKFYEWKGGRYEQID